MRNEWKRIVLSLLLGGIFPVLLLPFISNNASRSLDAVQDYTNQVSRSDSDIQIPVMLSDGSVVDLPIDTYLTGVVLCEMPADFEMEALKAQAVVARTYTLRRAMTGGKHKNAVVCTDPSCCQGYKELQIYIESGGSLEAMNRLQLAVSATDDLVLTYNEELIEATYFSCSGGRTEDAAAVWGTDIPYLQATASPGEEKAAHYADTVTFSAAEFQSLLGVEIPGNPGLWFGKVTYTEGGGVATIMIGGKEYQGTAVRNQLSLRSTAFVISAVGETITVTTKGFGHRVGMSQYGAEAMAVAGSDFREILAHYYLNAKLVSFSREMIDKVGVMKYNIA